MSRDAESLIMGRIGRLIALGDYGPALALARRALRADPCCWPAWERRAWLETRLGRSREARETTRRMLGVLAAGLRRNPQDGVLRLELSRQLDILGRYAEALSMLKRAPRAVEGDPRWRCRAAALCLKLGRYAEARRWASEKPLGPESLKVLGAVAVAQARPTQGLRYLDRAARLAREDAEAHLWRGEAYRSLGRLREARRELDLAQELFGAVAPPALRLNQTLLCLDLGTPPPMPVLAIHGGSGRAGRRLRLDLTRGPAPGARRALERALRKMKGDRSSSSSIRVGVAERTPARPYFVDPAGRDQLASWQAEFAANPGKTLAAFDALLKRRPGFGMGFSYRGEVNLWLGRYARARRDFERALSLDGSLRWPRTGLAGAMILRGQGERAARQLERAARAGAAEHVLRAWRGEWLRRAGRPLPALAELLAAARLRPGAPASWINLALADLALDETARPRRVLRWFLARAPAYMAEAARAAGLKTQALRRRPGPAAMARVLEAALALMRGNRSSRHPAYVREDGAVRALPVVERAL